MQQDVERTDQAVDAVDRIVDLGRKISEERRKHHKPDHFPVEGTGEDRENAIGAKRPLHGENHTNI